MEQGLLHLYWGDGKGKTTAAMGLALRALGSGKRVVIVQFLKGGNSGEIPILAQLGAEIYRGKAGQKFVFQMTPEEKATTRELQNQNLAAAIAQPADLLILDEAGSAEELDMVIHIGALKSGNWDYVRRDIGAVVAAAGDDVIVKVILETCLLTDEEIQEACLVSRDAGADYVKTSTGFSTGGATVEAVSLMKRTVGSDMKVKASGGIHTLEDARKMFYAGADRIGSSSGVAIAEAEMSEIHTI